MKKSFLGLIGIMFFALAAGTAYQAKLEYIGGGFVVCAIASFAFTFFNYLDGD